MVQNAGSFLKIEHIVRSERLEIGRFTYIMAYIFARTERKLERYCKIKDNDLRFEWMCL